MKINDKLLIIICFLFGSTFLIASQLYVYKSNPDSNLALACSPNDYHCSPDPNNPSADCGHDPSTGGRECSNSSSCFMPGTLITMDNGNKNIEDIKPGDIVQSFDPTTKEVVQSKVEKPYSVIRDHYYEVKTESGKTVKPTNEHPFFIGFNTSEKTLQEKVLAEANATYINIQDRLQGVDLAPKFDDELQAGFKRAMDLRIADVIYLLDENSKTLKAEKITAIKKFYGSHRVYNLMLEDSPNTYFADSFAVHNKKSPYTFRAGVFCRDTDGKEYPMMGVLVRMEAKEDFGGAQPYDKATSSDGWTPSVTLGRKDGIDYWNRARVLQLPSTGKLANGAPYSQMVFDTATTYGALACRKGDITGNEIDTCKNYSPDGSRDNAGCQVPEGKLCADGTGNKLFYKNCKPPVVPTPTPLPPQGCYKPCVKTNANACQTGMTCQTVNGQDLCVNPTYPTSNTCQGPVGCYQACSKTNPASCGTGMQCQTVNGSDKCVNPTYPTSTTCEGPKLCYQPCVKTNPAACGTGMQCQTVNGSDKCVNPTYPTSTTCQGPTTCYQPCVKTNPAACGSGMTCQTVNGADKCVNPTYPQSPTCEGPKACYQPCVKTNPQACQTGMTCQTVGGSDKCVNPQAPDSPTCSNVMACLELKPNKNTIGRPDQVVFTCKATAESNNVSYANFKALQGTTTVGSANNVTLTNKQAQWTFNVPANAAAGSYTVQCQVCNAQNQCTQWGKAN